MPTFSARSRRAIIEAGRLDWKDINPDIFGSMIQAVVDKEKRGGLGMHYTSVPNIMKVIEPLFLNDLRETFSKARGSRYKKHELATLRDRLGKLKIFDPACGSGNFLIIAYKELRQLEMDVIQEQQAGGDAGAMLFEQGAGAASRITLDQFYGIEIDDFAHEIAILALWLAEHQMNVRFRAQFGVSKPTLPLTEAGHIVHANACRVDWEEVCPKEVGDETYILGNPPYLGSRKQDNSHKSDLKRLGIKKYKSVDYITAWFLKGSLYINGTNSKCAFVSTNSLVQGEQVAMVWPSILTNNVTINFAHLPFKWDNSAKYKAAVIVVIIGLSTTSDDRFLYRTESVRKVENINPYLVDSNTVYATSRRNPISNLPNMTFGNMPADGGTLLLTTTEKETEIKDNPNVSQWIRKLVSAREFLNGKERWCYWLKDATIEDIQSEPLLREKVETLAQIRLNSSRPQLAEIPHLFAQITQPEGLNFILVPRHSSENRDYVPIGYFDPTHVAHDSCMLIATSELYVFALVTSRMHMVWLAAVGGRIKTDFRYSKDVVYNNYPIRNLSGANQAQLTATATGTNILLAREHHPGKTLADLYDPDKMPANLREAHRLNDEAVEACYRPEPFESDEERLEHLFKLYERMIAEEGERKLAKKT